MLMAISPFWLRSSGLVYVCTLIPPIVKRYGILAANAGLYGVVAVHSGRTCWTIWRISKAREVATADIGARFLDNLRAYG